MATPSINLELLEHFAPILLMILVFAIVYGVFQWAKILGDNKILHGIIAFIISLFVSIFSESARTVIRILVPWLSVLAIALVFGIMLYKVFGATDDDVRSVIKNRTDIQWTLFIVILVVFLYALSQAFGQQQLDINTDPNTEVNIPGNPGTTETGSGSFNQNLGATLYHPKVVGTLFLLIIGAMTVAFLSKPVLRT
jgi:hypothetical protein